ncbi:hypothetical protein BH09PSE1_BH09PSE1_25100 [soil metagenome]
MGEPKKHHRVPKSYLAQFIDGDGALWVYDPKSAGPRNSIPLNEAVETDLYSFIEPDGTRNTQVESALAALESAGMPVLKAVATGVSGIGTLSDDDRFAMAALVASIYLRSDTLRQHFANFEGRVLSRAAQLTMSHDGAWETFARRQAAAGKPISPEQRAATREFIADPSRYELHMRKDGTMMHLATLETVAKLMFQMEWTLLLAAPGEPLITSDNPAVLIIANEGRGFYRGGLGSPQAEVTLPLSPSVALLMHWRSGLSASFQANRETTRNLNRMRAGYAERCVYADRRSDGLWRLACKHVGEAIDRSGDTGEAPVKLIRPGKWRD